MKIFVIGDIHGGYKSLMQCIERSNIDLENDRLICLGDVADGWPDTPKCFDKLLEFKNLIYVLGNHDNWLLDWFKYKYTPEIWTSQGGEATLDAYQELFNNSEFDRINKHQDLLQNKSYYYYIDENNNVYVHGGFNWKGTITQTDPYNLMWDRHLWEIACFWQNLIDKEVEDWENLKIKDYNKVFIGHTSTSFQDKSLNPLKCSNVWNLDQGGGYEGKLTIMNVDTEEYWQSDKLDKLYPNHKGR